MTENLDIKDLINAHSQKEEILNHLIKSNPEAPVEAAPVTQNETSTEAVTEASSVAPEEAPVEKPEPKFAPGLFQNFTLGSTLVQTPSGSNAITNTKKTK